MNSKKKGALKKNANKKETEKIISNKNEKNIIVNNKVATNKAISGLGNSLFRGQKFIDFQEPFNESIKTIRNTNTNIQNKNSTNSTNNNLDEYNNEDMNMKFEQIEIKEMNEDDANSQRSFKEIQEENYEEEIHSKNDLISRNTPILINKKDDLIYKSKYFNNLNFPLQTCETQRSNTSFVLKENVNSNLNTPSKNNPFSERQSYIGDGKKNFIRPFSEKKNINLNLRSDKNDTISVKAHATFFDEPKKTSQESSKSGYVNHTQNFLFSTKANSNLLGSTNNNLITEYLNTNENIDFINTLVRLKGISKLDNSIISAHRNEDESKSYIKDFLENCPAPDKINEISNFEIKNFENEYVNNNQYLNSSSFFNNLNSLNIIGSGNKVLHGNQIGNNPQRLKIDQLIEISNKRKNMMGNMGAYPISNANSNDAYLKRRHVESLGRLEKMKKEKEEKDNMENKFSPSLNKKSINIMAERDNRKLLSNNLQYNMNSKFSDKNLNYDIVANVIIRNLFNI